MKEDGKKKGTNDDSNNFEPTEWCGACNELERTSLGTGGVTSSAMDRWGCSGGN